MKPHLLHRIVRSLAVVCTLIYAQQNVVAQSTNHLLFDFNQSEFFGAENLLSVHKLFHTAEEHLIPSQLFDETTFGKKLVGIGYRGGKLLILDRTVNYMLYITQHEVFGHGSRWREVGASEISYELNLPFPLGPGTGRTITTPALNRITSGTERLMSIAGGMEANSLLAHQLEYRWLQDQALHYHQGLLYLQSRNDIVGYIWRDKLFGTGSTFSGSDPLGWVFDINVQFGSIDKLYSLDRIAIQSLFSLLNPFQAYSAFGIAKTYVLDGKNVLDKLPAIPFGMIKVLPTISFNLTPFGSEFIFNNYVIGKQRLADVQFNIGDPLFHKFGMLSINVHDLFKADQYSIGVQVGSWDQPDVQLGGTIISEHRGGIGGFGKVQLNWFPLKGHRNLGLYASAGYKTVGYLMGETLDKNMIMRFGVSFRLEASPP
jgi:hypothetical protein